ncbi:hypothetical protein [Solimonas sp. SE-A11]|uniref:hypothetical protein n=1 Tax=Solimonas sp. SE-A11 TaxID=3054954 RepID=UPI00259CF1A9|nr:hypothetical protein [Solimonas sp. SE-A11]MDM4769871.1 hypothetical protein [Solimonas sp. SE-A11]
MDATLTRLLQLLAADDGQSLPRVAKKLALRHSQLHRLLTAIAAGNDLRGIIVISGEDPPRLCLGNAGRLLLQELKP